MPNDRQVKKARLEKEISGSHLIDSEVFGHVVHKTRMPMALSDPNLPDCPLVFVNPAFTEMTGYDAQQVLGRNCRFLQGAETDPEAAHQIRRALAAQRSISLDLYNYRRDGSGFWNALYISPIFGEDGRLSYFFASQVDVSARKEALRRQTQRIESMGALASGVAHEFNNLMTVVLGSIERAAGHTVDEAQKRQLERADWGAQRAGRLASELLSLARRQVQDSLVIDLAAFIGGFKDTLAQLVPGAVRLEVKAPAEKLPVRLDADQLELVLLNLVRNAVDAMPQGGSLTITVRPLSQPEAASVLVGGRSAIELQVADTGEGMPPEVASRATELFFTTKPHGKGTGLGLFLALDFIDRSAGRLAIESQPGRGTRIKLIFPQGG